MPVSFAKDIAPLFTESQRECMIDTFDLMIYEDVKLWSKPIYERLVDKTMPADDTGPWPDDRIALFKRWMDEGFPP